MVVTLETNQDLFEHQLELEADMLTGGVNRFRKARDKAIEKGRESHLPHGRAIVGTVVGQVAQGIEQYLANPSNPSRDIAWKRVRNMDAEQVAYLSVVSLVDSISRKNTLLHVARTIGTNIEMQDRLDRWVHAEGSVAKNTIKEAMKKAYGARRYGLTHKMNKDGYEELAWLKSERVHVGFKMVDIIIQHTGIVKLDTQQTERKRRATYVKPTDGTLEFIKAFNEYMEVSRPRYLPCIVPPKDWTDVQGGGFHGHDIDELPIVRRK
jgi:DNA-directed RNA polymerase, mitochondrial